MGRVSPVLLAPSFEGAHGMAVLLQAAPARRHGSAKRPRRKRPGRGLAVSRRHSLPKGTGTFPAASRKERAPRLCAAKPCFPCPPGKRRVLTKNCR